MVGFLAKPAQTTERAEEEDSKVKSFKDPLDFPSIDLDFDWIPWVGSSRNIEEFSIEDKDFDFFSDEMEIGQESVDVSEETRLENQTAVRSEFNDVQLNLCDDISGESGLNLVSSEVNSELCDDISVNADEAAVNVSEPVIISDDSRPIDENVAVVSSAFVASPDMTLDESELKKTDEGLACSIQKGLEKVSLAMDNVGKKSDETNKKTDSESETSSSSSSTSDSSSSSDEEESDEDESEEEESEEEEEKKEEESKEQIVVAKESGVVGELEEGEIGSVDEEAESNICNEDDDDDEEEVDEMIAWSNDEEEDLGLQSKEPIRSKNELKELPPVPPLNVTLEPHHVTLPVGVVLSVVGTQVIVMGAEKHNPLNEGSILWITESRTPLGLVDELFGPVKCPYYIVRYNSESEVPEGISEGTSVSFVADFAQHILNIKELHTRGYDASGDNDEEISEEYEFSDDEKEAEHKKMQKMEKRGLNEQRSGNKRNKKKNNRDLGRSANNPPGQWRDKLEPQETFMTTNPSSNRFDSQPQPHMDGFPPNHGAWRPQSNQQNPYQLPMSNLHPMQLPMIPMQNQMPSSNQMMFQQQQFSGGQMPIPNLGGPGGLNFFGGQGSAPWAALVGQNCFNQPFGMGVSDQPRAMQQALPNATQAELNFNLFAAAQGFQMQRPQSQINPQSQMRPQFQTPMNQLYQMHPPMSPINQQFQIRPQTETSPRSPINLQFQPEMQSQSQGFSSGSSSARGRGHRGHGRGRGRGRFGRGRGRQQPE